MALRRARNIFADNGLRLSRSLQRIVLSWLSRGLRLSELEYACLEAARYGSFKFVYVQEIVERLLDQDPVSESCRDVGDSDDTGVIDLWPLRAKRG
jgi:hypothetical protein